MLFNLFRKPVRDEARRAALVGFAISREGCNGEVTDGCSDPTAFDAHWPMRLSRMNEDPVLMARIEAALRKDGLL